MDLLATRAICHSKRDPEWTGCLLQLTVLWPNFPLRKVFLFSYVFVMEMSSFVGQTSAHLERWEARCPRQQIQAEQAVRGFPGTARTFTYDHFQLDLTTGIIFGGPVPAL